MLGLIPTPYKLGGAILLAALFGWKMYSAGADSVQHKWDAQKAVALAAVAAAKERSAAISAAIDTRHLAEAERIRTVFKTINKEVKVYVDKTADSTCTVPSGFVRIHDAAAGGTLPEAPSSADAAPSGVEISTVAETVAENYGTYAEIRQRLIDLQDWVARQGQ